MSGDESWSQTEKQNNSIKWEYNPDLRAKEVWGKGWSKKGEKEYGISFLKQSE